MAAKRKIDEQWDDKYWLCDIGRAEKIREMIDFRLEQHGRFCLNFG